MIAIRTRRIRSSASWVHALATFALIVALLPRAAVAQTAVPATYLGFLRGDCGEWIAKLPGCWAFIDFSSPWKFFPDNGNGKSFAALIPQGEVVLDSDSVIDDTGVVIPFLGVSVSTLALGSEAHLIIAPAGSLSVTGLGGVGGLITNQGRITLQGSAVLETPFVTQLLGSGEIVLDSETSFLRALLLLSQADGHTVRGHGNIVAASLLNEGAIVADSDERALVITGALLTNDGLLRAGGLTAGAPGGELRLSPVQLDNSGEIVAEGGFLKIDGSRITNSGVITARALGTVVLEDVTINGSGGTMAVQSTGGFFFNGANRVNGGALIAAMGTEFAIGPGTTTLSGNVSLDGLLATRGGTLRFDGVDLGMPAGTIEIATGVVATTSGGLSSFRGGTWQGGGVLDARTPTRWDGTSILHNRQLTIDLHTATHRALGTLRNDAEISLVNDAGFNQVATLLLEGDLALTGSGRLRLRGTNGPTRITGVGAGPTLRNGAAHRIGVETSSSATIDVDVVNDGVLDARGNNAQLFMPVASLRNRGVLGAYDGATLTLRDSASGVALIHNTGGRIDAGNNGRVVFFNVHPSGARTTIRGGTLAGNGRFEAGQRSALDGANDGAVTIASGATVRVLPGTSLFLTGEIVNDGLIDIADTTNFTSGGGTLWIDGDVRLNGTGRTLFTERNEMQIRGTSATARLHVGEGQTVGSLGSVLGTIHVDLTNAGRIEARGTSSFLALPVVQLRNTGVLGAYDGGVLRLRDTGLIDQLVHNTGGRIDAGSGSVVEITGSTNRLTTIRGGAITGAGRTDALGRVLFDGVTDGAVTIASGATVRLSTGTNLFLSGSIVNDGTLDLADTTGHFAGNSTLWINNTVELGGAGRVVFSLLNEMQIRGSSDASRLDVGELQTITTLGNVEGIIHSNLANAGRIEARNSNAFLALAVREVRNTGSLGAYDGGVLTLRGTGTAAALFDNRGGRIEAAANSRVVLSDGHPSVQHRTTIRGGSISGAGRVDVTRLVAFDGATGGAVTIDAGATVRVGALASLFLSGQILNNGTVELADTTNFTSGEGTLWIEGDVALDGTGKVLFSLLNEMHVRGTSSAARLQLGEQQSITTLANVSGALEVDMTNRGRVETRGANSTLFVQTPDVRNTGVLGAYEGAVLTLRHAGLIDGVFHNAGGIIEAGAASRIVLSDGHPLVNRVTTIRGGTLAGAGRIETGRLVVFDGSTDGALTIASNATVRVGAGSNLFLAGAIVNDGLLELNDTTNHTSGAGTLWIDGDVELAGTGQTLFTRLNEMRIQGRDAASRLHIGSGQTIGTRGNVIGGVLGTVQVALTNAGHIEARGAGAFLAIETNDIVNRGRLGALDGGTGRVGSALGRTVIDNRDGVLHASGTGRLTLHGATHPSHTATTVVRGGVVGGSGTIVTNGLVSFADGVVVAPGNSPGVLTIDGNLALDPLGSLDIELLGVTLGTEYDQLRVHGRLSLAGALRVLLPTTFRPNSTDVFTVLTADELLGSFSNVRDGRFEFGFGSFAVSSDQRSLRLTDFLARVDPIGVPEPAPLLLLGVILLTVARRRQGTCRPR